jgi:hypothetical protein
LNNRHLQPRCGPPLDPGESGLLLADLSRSALRPAGSAGARRSRQLARRSSDGGGPVGNTGNAGGPSWPGGGSPRLAAPARPKNRRACAPFLGLSLARCSASDPESPLLPIARRPPCGTTNPSKEESFLEGFVVPGRGRLGAAGPVSMAARRAERPRETCPCSRPLSGPRAARPGEYGSREGRRDRGAPRPGLTVPQVLFAQSDGIHRLWR